MTTDTPSPGGEPDPPRPWYLRLLFSVLIALAINAVCVGAALLSRGPAPSPPDPPYTGPAGAVPVGGTATCPDGVAATVTVQAEHLPGFLGPTEEVVIVTTRVVNRSSHPVTAVRVSLSYDPALREDASPVTLPEFDPPLPLPPGGVGTQSDEFSARTAGLVRFDIEVTMEVPADCYLDFREAGPIATTS
jgi:hypothetical protein